MASGKQFLTQSGLLLLVNCCSALSLSTAVRMVYHTSEVVAYVTPGSLLWHIRKDVKVGFALWPGGTGRRRYLLVAGGFLSCSAAQSFLMGRAEMLGERLQWTQPSYVCLQLDKNYSGDLAAFKKGTVRDKALSGDNDKRAEAENERAAG